jgi:N-acetylglutamate synthase-like GNAT family acetyltransferase
MRLIRANQVSVEKMEEFLTHNQNVKKDGLMKHGYVVEMDGKIEGCFVLEEMDNEMYWLKQLYITQTQAARLPVLLESILALAKEQHAKTVYVHSHQPVVDIILDALQFHPQKENTFVDKRANQNGNWWSYQVS